MSPIFICPSNIFGVSQPKFYVRSIRVNQDMSVEQQQTKKDLIKEMQHQSVLKGKSNQRSDHTTGNSSDEDCDVNVSDDKVKGPGGAEKTETFPNRNSQVNYTKHSSREQPNAMAVGYYESRPWLSWKSSNPQRLSARGRRGRVKRSLGGSYES